MSCPPWQSDPHRLPTQQLRSRHHVSLPPTYYSSDGLDLESQLPAAQAPQSPARHSHSHSHGQPGSSPAQTTPSRGVPPPNPQISGQSAHASGQPAYNQALPGAAPPLAANYAANYSPAHVAASVHAAAPAHAVPPPQVSPYHAQLHNSQLHNSQLHNSQLHNSQLHNSQLHNSQSHNSQSHNAGLQHQTQHQTQHAYTPASSQQPPRSRRVRSISDSKPAIVKVPKARRVKPEGGFMSPLMASTTYSSSTYTICDARFQYSQTKNPRRVLTEPHEGKSNHGFDNAENDYISYVNDVLGTDENRRYLASNSLGKGTFGQVVKCQNMATMEVVAVKVIKNKPAFLNQSMMEVSVLEHIQQNVDRDAKHNSSRLKDRFMHKEHSCLVFESSSSNSYEIIKKNEFRGLGINVVRTFTQQLSDSSSVLKSSSLIHCDSKPENISSRRPDSLEIKVIDFGSACHERQTVYTYIQSRFYRSPEVISGSPYTSAIDMWSLGCIVAESFLGSPIFPGSSEFNQWSRIVASLGMPPQWMSDAGKNTSHFMVKTPQGHWRMRTIEEQNATFHAHEKDGRRYFASNDIHETIMSYPSWNSSMTQAEIDEEMKQRSSSSDFVRGSLNYNPFERWTPQQAAMHPFITNKKFVGPFSPQASDPAQHIPTASPYVPQSPPQQHPPQQISVQSHIGSRYPTMPQQIPVHMANAQPAQSQQQPQQAQQAQPAIPASMAMPAQIPPQSQPIPPPPQQPQPQMPAMGSSAVPSMMTRSQMGIAPPPPPPAVIPAQMPQKMPPTQYAPIPASYMQPIPPHQLAPVAASHSTMSPQHSTPQHLTPQHTQQHMSTQYAAGSGSANNMGNANNMNSMNNVSSMGNAGNVGNVSSVNNTGQRRLGGQTTGRGRSATIGQVNSMVPVPIQQAASRMDPNQVIQSHDSPAYFPPRGYYQGP